MSTEDAPSRPHGAIPRHRMVFMTLPDIWRFTLRASMNAESTMNACSRKMAISTEAGLPPAPLVRSRAPPARVGGRSRKVIVCQYRVGHFVEPGPRMVAVGTRISPRPPGRRHTHSASRHYPVCVTPHFRIGSIALAMSEFLSPWPCLPPILTSARQCEISGVTSLRLKQSLPIVANGAFPGRY